MDLLAYFIDARRLTPGEAARDRPLALIDLDATDDDLPPIVPPPCPLIGIGDPSHPLAAALDAVIEPPVSAGGLAAQIVYHPRAAAVLVQLLRLLPGMAEQDALAAESLAYAVLQGSEEHRRWLAARDKAPASADPGTVRLERRDDRLIVTLDRPQAGNAIDRPMRDGLYEAFELATLDPELRRVSLRAEGKAFCLGADLAEFGTTTDPAMAHTIRMQTLPARMAAHCAEQFDAHVRGACVGAGLELAAWAARLTASADAWFQLPELAMGILPGAGGCVSLIRRFGRQRTALLALSGKRLSARQALAWGLIDAIEGEPPGD